MKTEKPLARRQFLKTLATGTAAAGAAMAAAPAVMAADAPTTGDSKTTGYRESEHVRRYYAAARGQ
ncbi:formate dehydrogenase [Ferrimonas balearica]|uniref:formate dehydrogenase n=1 Tax=Ferrimonas balearica TaxID=44012 RepID=UPI001C59A99F|nr:formate dehydrogenase [Ferrimonas balearica]MBW3140854.1 formate dehydrogenase [Ferrimonas balearica]MBW3165943.1 formate dehydrogenase [Ferrimonas balearica]MBY5981853.1 formate dehydrogenase [Ferrimonas balearica]MBY6108121.1 formate dehydrogenase [Ferrimonas balearica]MBY6225464.1 formate dehydrogenase [Ferrimonas balearica]